MATSNNTPRIQKTIDTIKTISVDDMKFLWDLTGELLFAANNTNENAEILERIDNRAWTLEDIRTKLATIREFVTGEYISNLDSTPIVTSRNDSL